MKNTFHAFAPLTTLASAPGGETEKKLQMLKKKQVLEPRRKEEHKARVSAPALEEPTRGPRHATLPGQRSALRALSV